MKAKVLLLTLLTFILLTGPALAVDWSPQGNITLKNRYYIKNWPVANCSGTDVVHGIFANGTWNCQAPTAGSGDIEGITTAGDYLLGGCLIGQCNLTVNDTVLNATIDARDSDTTYTAGTGITLTGVAFAVNDTYLQTLYILLTDESNLDVNSSDYWDNLGSPSDINAADITDDNTYVEVAGDTMGGNLAFGNQHGITGIDSILGQTDENLHIKANDSTDLVFNYQRNAGFSVRSDFANGSTTPRFSINSGSDTATASFLNTNINMNDGSITHVTAITNDDGDALSMATGSKRFEINPGASRVGIVGAGYPITLYTMNTAGADTLRFKVNNGSDTVDIDITDAILDMNNNIITNIGAAGTDFTATGGLNLADNLHMSNTESITGVSVLAGTNAGNFNIRANDSTDMTLNYGRDATLAIWSDNSTGHSIQRLYVHTGTDIVEIDLNDAILDLSDNSIKGISTVTSHLIPTTDNTYDLGNSSLEWRNLYVDGTAYVDAIDLPSNAISEAEVDFDTTCASGNHLYVNGNNLACEADDDNPEAGDVLWSDLTDQGSFTDTKFCTYASGTGFISCTSDGGGSTYYAGSGLDLNGSNYFSILNAYAIPQGCNDGEIAEYNTTSGGWDCGVDNTAGSGMAKWVLAALGIGGSEDITDSETVTFGSGNDYIDVSRTTNNLNYTLNDTVLNATISDLDTNTQLSEEQVEDYVGGMLGGTETHIAVTYQDATNDIDFVVSDDWWDADADIAADEISEGKIGFSTACASGNHYYLNGNDLACEADADTQLSEEQVEDFTGGMLGGTETHIAVTYQDGTNDIDFVVSDDWWDADGDISADEISEGKISFSTACGAGNHYYLNGNDLACEADDDTHLTDEQVQDKSGAMWTGNTETRATVTYQDLDGTIDVVVDDMNDEVVDDATPQLGGNLDANAHDIEVDTNNKVCLNGATCTKYIYYDGSNVIIQG